MNIHIEEDEETMTEMLRETQSTTNEVSNLLKTVSFSYFENLENGFKLEMVHFLCQWLNTSQFPACISFLLLDSKTDLASRQNPYLIIN